MAGWPTRFERKVVETPLRGFLAPDLLPLMQGRYGLPGLRILSAKLGEKHRRCGETMQHREKAVANSQCVSAMLTTARLVLDRLICARTVRLRYPPTPLYTPGPFLLISAKLFWCCVAIEQYDGMIPLAINAAQYDGSRMCGACVKVTGTGEGAGHDPITGTFDGFIMDQCPECSFGVSFSSVKVQKYHAASTVYCISYPLQHLAVKSSLPSRKQQLGTHVRTKTVV